MKIVCLRICLLLILADNAVGQSTQAPAVSAYPAAVQIRLHAALSKVALEPARQQALAQYYLREDSLVLAALQADSTLMPQKARLQVQKRLQAELDSLFTIPQRIGFYHDTESVEEQSQQMSRLYRLSSSDSVRIRQFLTDQAKAVAILHATRPAGVEKETLLTALRRRMQDSISRVLVMGAYVQPETEYGHILAYQKQLQLTPRQITQLAQADAEYKLLSSPEKESMRRPFARQAKPVDYHQLWAFHRKKLTSLLTTTQYLTYLRQANQKKAQAKAEQEWKDALALGLTADQDSAQVVGQMKLFHLDQLVIQTRLDLDKTQQVVLQNEIMTRMPSFLRQLRTRQKNPNAEAMQKKGFQW